jgi:radical SAM superfamily enzyme YgiQ (UPF0313 family)
MVFIKMSTDMEVFMKVLLTAINAKYIHSNLAVYSLRAYAGKYAQQTEIAEYTINQPMDDILSDIYKKRPDVLCLSCYLWNILYVEQLITEISKVLPGTQIWLGGPEVSYNAVSVMEQYPQVTGVMCGEGEETFLELMEYWNQERESLDTIKGIVYRENGTCRQNPPRPVMDLSKVPFVYDHIEDFQNKIIYYESSRGCPFSCSYCLSSIDKCLRFRNLELVKKELQFFIDHEVPQVKFVDRTFNCKHSHSMAIWTYLKEHDRGKTNFHFEVAADLLNEEEMELIASMRPGLIQLEIGIQSTNPETITEIRRKMNFEEVKRIVKRVQEKGNVHQHLDLIAGLPYEDYERFAQSFRDVYALHPEQLQLGFLKVLKGSYMHEKTEDYQLLYQDRSPFEVLSTKWLSYDDVIRLKGVEEMVEVYYNSGQFVNTLRLLEEEFTDTFALYESLSRYYEENGLHMINHSRITRYEVLFAFIKACVEKNVENYRQMLILDLYLRENVKKRPEFAGEVSVDKQKASAFYEKEAEERRYLKGYEGYDKRQLRKMTHLEQINGNLYVFDYRNRNVLTNQASVFWVEGGDETSYNACPQQGDFV